MAHMDADDLDILWDDDIEQLDIPLNLPLLPVRDVVVFTHMLLPLFVGRDKSVRAIEAAMGKDKYLFISMQTDPAIEDPKPEQIFPIGTVGRILRIQKLPDGRFKVLVQGLVRGRILNYQTKHHLFRVKIEKLVESPIQTIDLEIEALMRNVREHCENILSTRGDTHDAFTILEEIDHPGRLADLIASNLRLKIDEAQSILETIDPVERLKHMNQILSREAELSAMQAEIESRAREEVLKNQRDYFLREQVRAIHRELGDADEKALEAKGYAEKIKRAKMSKEAEQEAKKQLSRLEQMHPDAAEAPVIRTYLDWLVELPWHKATTDTLDIEKAKKILDRNHHGLAKVKERILEHLSVRKLNPHKKGPILCFVGPPGVGKTSLGQAIAQAMNRKFFRLSLGGMRDEAEIRGHRRTYVGALPGRILQGLKQCGSNNPVFVMDEIDKIGSDFRGDPASALLETLDPEQNHAFSDHYLNVSFDLSKVMFITTANVIDTIPSALLDRMELIPLSGYTEEEKTLIAQKHLVHRMVKENGLSTSDFHITAGAIGKIINEYTSESGLRNLERELGAVCRKASRKKAEGEKGPFSITIRNLRQYLGLPPYFPEMDQESDQIGLATGLAWTYAGGEPLYVEATTMRGKGDLIMTGQLGEIMQESARAALSYTRVNLSLFGLEEDFFEGYDVHIHVPSGAIPKDGPSAGIAIATALISVLIGRPVRNDVAMTGEITIRGRVLPVGGLKEKSLGAMRAGIRTVIIPEKNRMELSELPKTVTRKLTFIPIKHIDEVFEIALLPQPTEEGESIGNR